MICPPLKPIDPKIIESIHKLYSDIQHYQSHQPNPITAIGLEQRAALLALQGQMLRVVPDNESWKSKCQSLFVRPSLEPSVHLFRHSFDTNILDHDIVDRLVATLTGFNVKRRLGRSFGTSINGDVEFEDIGTSQNWITDCNSFQSLGFHSALRPYYAFIRTIFAHPYEDGNGRLARFIMLTGIANAVGSTAVYIPLAPAFYLNANQFVNSMRQLSLTGDWDDSIACLVHIMRDALKLAQMERDFAANATA